MDGKDEMFRALEEVDRQNRQRQYLANQLEDQIEDLEKKLKETKERNAALNVEADLAEMKVQASEATWDSKKRQKEMQVIQYEELVKELGECQDRLDFLAAEYTRKENWFKAKLDEAHKVNESWLKEYMKDPGFKARMEEKVALAEAKALLEKKSAALQELSAKTPEVWKDFKEKCVQFAEAMLAYNKEEKIAKELRDDMEKLDNELTPLKSFNRSMSMSSGQSTPRRSTFESTWMTAFQKRTVSIGSKTREDLRRSPALKMLETMAYSSRYVPHRQSSHEPVRLHFPDSANVTPRATVQVNEMDTRSFSQDRGAQEMLPATSSSRSQHNSPTVKSFGGSNEPITSAQPSDQMQQIPFVPSPEKECDVTQPPMPSAVSQTSTAETEIVMNQTITIESQSQSQNFARNNDLDTFRAPLPPPPRQAFLSTPAGALSQSQTDIGFGNGRVEQGSSNGSTVGFQYAPPSPSQACEGLNFDIFGGGPASGSSSPNQASNESGGFFFGGGGFGDLNSTEDKEGDTGPGFYFGI